MAVEPKKMNRVWFSGSFTLEQGSYRAQRHMPTQVVVIVHLIIFFSKLLILLMQLGVLFFPKLLRDRLVNCQYLMGFRGLVFHSKEVNKWCMPFMGSDASVVRRSQRYRAEVAKKDPIQYGAYSVMDSLFAIIMLMIFGPIFALLCRFQWGRSLLEKVCCYTVKTHI